MSNLLKIEEISVDPKEPHPIHLPRTREAQALARELLDYEIRVAENATDRYGAFRGGTHDDLATALGLAVQIDEPVGSTR